MMVCAVLGCDLLGSDWKNELSEISFLQRVCVLSDRGRVKSSIIQEGLLSVSEQKYTTSVGLRYFSLLSDCFFLI